MGPLASVTEKEELNPAPATCGCQNEREAGGHLEETCRLQAGDRDRKDSAESQDPQADQEGKLAKGDPLAISKTMAILAVKKTPELLALCHPLRIEHVDVVEKINRRLDRSHRDGLRAREDRRGDGGADGGGRRAPEHLGRREGLREGLKGQYPSTRIEGIRVLEKVKRNGRA